MQDKASISFSKRRNSNKNTQELAFQNEEKASKNKLFKRRKSKYKLFKNAGLGKDELFKKKKQQVPAFQ